ncbi:MAG: hypothetical protein ACJA19_000069 [Bacteroidia bacterium]|jgi:hypothetical protein
MEGEIFLNDEGLLEGIPKKIIEKKSLPHSGKDFK